MSITYDTVATSVTTTQRVFHCDNPSCPNAPYVDTSSAEIRFSKAPPNWYVLSQMVTNAGDPSIFCSMPCLKDWTAAQP